MMRKATDLLNLKKVHPAGRYRHNTVIHVLRKELGVSRLYRKCHDPIYPRVHFFSYMGVPVAANRLDRPTSGLMLIGLNSERARQFESQMVQGKIQKEYVCRVVGEFPE